MPQCKVFHAPGNKYVGDEFPKIMATTNENDYNQFISQNSDASIEIRDLSRLQAVLANKASDATFLAGKSSECLKLDYWLWFAHWSEDAIVEIDQRTHPWNNDNDYPPVRHDMRKLISKFGSDVFVKDGKGRKFMPGLFCFVWYAETFDIPVDDDIKREFESETLMGAGQNSSSS